MQRIGHWLTKERRAHYSFDTIKGGSMLPGRGSTAVNPTKHGCNMKIKIIITDDGDTYIIVSGGKNFWC